MGSKFKIRRYIILICTCILVLSCSLDNKQQSNLDVIQELLDSLYKARIFNGAIAIAQGDSIVFAKGYGYANFKDSIPFTVNTAGDGGSLAKTFTAATLWKLQSQGKINLTDSVQKFLPEYPYSNTTVLDLITHNAGGLPPYDFFLAKISDTSILTNNLMLSLLGKYHPPLLDPQRQGFNYENTGIDLAALIIEKVTGKNYQHVLTQAGQRFGQWRP